MKLPKNLGMLLLEIYLVLVGILGLMGGISVSISTIVAVIAIVAGVLLFLDK